MNLKRLAFQLGIIGALSAIVACDAADSDEEASGSAVTGAPGPALSRIEAEREAEAEAMRDRALSKSALLQMYRDYHAEDLVSLDDTDVACIGPGAKGYAWHLLRTASDGSYPIPVRTRMNELARVMLDQDFRLAIVQTPTGDDTFEVTFVTTRRYQELCGPTAGPRVVRLVCRNVGPATGPDEAACHVPAATTAESR